MHSVILQKQKTKVRSNMNKLLTNHTVEENNLLKQMSNLLEEINQAHTKNKHINFFKYRTEADELR
jgi:hypothetical protein